ncbi:MAG TPA: M20/M25/M40 family metallo-hydrolase [bacterium]|nr:M20/M25/M40 family metallo-hydrolase [bacterium]
MNAVELTREFVKIPSLTPEEEAFAQHLEKLFEQAGWKASRHEIADNRWNLYVVPDDKIEPEVVFCAHLDTVAPFLEYDEDEEYIYGRGSCDDKGVMASMIEAAIRLVAEGHTRIGLLFTVGEEVDSIGAKVANDRAPGSVKYTLIGEPTENTLIAGQKGIYIAEVTTSGKPAHSAYPVLGESAVNKLLDILERVRQAELPVDPGLGETTLNISKLTGGDRYNVIPDEAGAGLMFRVATSTADVEHIVRKAVGDQGTIEVINRSEPQTMVRIPGYDQGIVAFGSDIPYLTKWGERLMLGPGSIHDAHTDHEKISKRAIRDAVRLYVDIAKYLFSQ